MRAIITLLLVFSCKFSIAQNVYITLGTNWFLPQGKNHYATMHPLNRIQIHPYSFVDANYLGGFQISGIYNKPLKKNVDINLKLSLAKYAFWELLKSTDLSAQPTGIYFGALGNYSVIGSGTLQYKIRNSLSIGAGLGLNIGLIHYLKFTTGPVGFKYNNYGKTDGRLLNPLVPIRLQWTPGRFMFGAEYSQALLRHHRTYENTIKGTHYGLIQFDLGYKIFPKRIKKKAKSK